MTKTTLLLFFSLLILASAAETQDDVVLHLSQSNFSSITEGKDFVILFFSPWCGHCKHFKPTWLNFAKEVNGTIGLGDIDGTKEFSLMNQFGVTEWPTVILMKNGSRYRFNGNRTVADLKDFITGGYLKQQPMEIPKSPVPKISVPKLQPSPKVAKNNTKTSATTNAMAATTTTTEEPKTLVSGAWLKVMIVCAILLAVGLIYLLCYNTGQNEKHTSNNELHEDELDDEEEYGDYEEESKDNLEKDEETLDSSVIGIEMIENV